MRPFRTCRQCVIRLARAQSNMRFMRSEFDIAGGGALTSNIRLCDLGCMKAQALLLVYCRDYPVLRFLRVVWLGMIMIDFVAGADLAMLAWLAMATASTP